MILEQWNSNLNLPKTEECGVEPIWNPIKPLLAWKRWKNDDDDDDDETTCHLYHCIDIEYAVAACLLYASKTNIEKLEASQRFSARAFCGKVRSTPKRVNTCKSPTNSHKIPVQWRNHYEGNRQTKETRSRQSKRSREPRKRAEDGRKQAEHKFLVEASTFFRVYSP